MSPIWRRELCRSSICHVAGASIEPALRRGSLRVKSRRHVHCGEQPSVASFVVMVRLTAIHTTDKWQATLSYRCKEGRYLFGTTKTRPC